MNRSNFYLKKLHAVPIFANTSVDILTKKTIQFSRDNILGRCMQFIIKFISDLLTKVACGLR